MIILTATLKQSNRAVRGGDARVAVRAAALGNAEIARNGRPRGERLDDGDQRRLRGGRRVLAARRDPP